MSQRASTPSTNIAGSAEAANRARTAGSLLRAPRTHSTIAKNAKPAQGRMKLCLHERAYARLADAALRNASARVPGIASDSRNATQPIDEKKIPSVVCHGMA